MRQCKSIARRRRRRSKRTTCPWCVTHHRHIVACHRGLRCMCAPTVFPCNRVAAAARRRARHRDPMRRMPCCALCSMRPAACTPRLLLQLLPGCSARMQRTTAGFRWQEWNSARQPIPSVSSCCAVGMPTVLCTSKAARPADAAVSLAPGARHPCRPHFQRSACAGGAHAACRPTSALELGTFYAELSRLVSSAPWKLGAALVQEQLDNAERRQPLPQHWVRQGQATRADHLER
jgi:hypothetical protein